MQLKHIFSIVIAVGLFGCKPDAPETIRILGENSSNLQAIEQATPEFERTHNIKVIIEKVSFGEALEKANQDLPLGTGRYDIVLQYNFTLSSYVEGGYVWSLDELKTRFPNVNTKFESAIFPNAWREVGYYYYGTDLTQSKAFGYPFAANTMLLVYNRDMLEDATAKERYRKRFGRELAVPTTWEEFKNVADFFTDPSAGTHGVVLQGASDGWLYYEYAAMLSSQDGSILPKQYGWEKALDAQVDLTQGKPFSTAQYYLSLKPYNAGDFTKMDATAQRELFKARKIALAVMWSDYVYDLAFESGIQSKHFGFAPIPGQKSPLAGGSYYINKRSRHTEAAYTFLSWLMDPNRQASLVHKGLASPLESAYTPEVLKAVPYAAALATSVKRGRYAYEANRDSDLIQVQLTSAIQQAWNKPTALADFLLEASKEINKRRPLVYKN